MALGGCGLFWGFMALTSLAALVCLSVQNLTDDLGGLEKPFTLRR